MGAGGHDGGDLVGGHDGADGHSGRQSLGGSYDVWHYVVVVHAPPFSGTSHTGLHLVHDHEGAVVGTQVADTVQELGGGADDASLSLDSLDHEGGGVAVHHVLD